jgi:di/tricarboxylate transporter
MPMNYATVLGGMCTLVGTSTNLIVAGLVLQEPGMDALRMFDPLGVGAAAALAGIAYLLLAGRWLLPERASALQQASRTGEFAVEMLVEAEGAIVG